MNSKNNTTKEQISERNRKPRIKWTKELHQHFVQTINQLGGPYEATPKKIVKLMGIKEITSNHIKSHLQILIVENLLLLITRGIQIRKEQKAMAEGQRNQTKSDLKKKVEFDDLTSTLTHASYGNSSSRFLKGGPNTDVESYNSFCDSDMLTEKVVPDKSKLPSLMENRYLHSSTENYLASINQPFDLNIYESHYSLLKMNNSLKKIKSGGKIKEEKSNENEGKSFGKKEEIERKRKAENKSKKNRWKGEFVPSCNT
ncbi:hypothetical protein M9H77_07969 [Catharanthus roseus]|uniref:Uncharacterized protein n=1 Tax=Catharanthus roseus TaxID=4058 RepID=A0ACC0BWN8_CATRO|nr:hypothetical protein M9H77_07969 [Catharanthus roseus]